MSLEGYRYQIQTLNQVHFKKNDDGKCIGAEHRDEREEEEDNQEDSKVLASSIRNPSTYEPVPGSGLEALIITTPATRFLIHNINSPASKPLLKQAPTIAI
ncbi:hypothetical protein V6N13_102640 [Hibiscus sabdariffa]